MSALSGPALRRYNRRVQMVFQDPYGSLNPRMTAGETLAEPLRVHRIVPPAQIPARVAELLDLVRLPADAAGRLPHAFSRRAAPAAGDRPRAHGRAGTADRGRDRLRPGRVGAGADPEPAARHAGASRPGDGVRLA
ncbi:MAG: hypothetical protein WDN49_13410 [Acetobacteraceae bacterium]